ncbi:MAG: hypothetical protein ACFFCU_16580 [Promethearchaeota archaeon]
MNYYKSLFFCLLLLVLFVSIANSEIQLTLVAFDDNELLMKKMKLIQEIAKIPLSTSHMIISINGNNNFMRLAAEKKCVAFDDVDDYQPGQSL